MKRLISLIIVLLFVLLLSGCQKSKEQQIQEAFSGVRIDTNKTNSAVKEAEETERKMKEEQRVTQQTKQDFHDLGDAVKESVDKLLSD